MLDVDSKFFFGTFSSQRNHAMPRPSIIQDPTPTYKSHGALQMRKVGPNPFWRYT